MSNQHLSKINARLHFSSIVNRYPYQLILFGSTDTYTSTDTDTDTSTDTDTDTSTDTDTDMDTYIIISLLLDSHGAWILLFEFSPMKSNWRRQETMYTIVR